MKMLVLSWHSLWFYEKKNNEKQWNQMYYKGMNFFDSEDFHSGW